MLQQPNVNKYDFHVGQNLDVLDSVNKWMNAQVLFVGNGTIFIHYTGWSAKYDQSLSIDSPKILTQWQPNKPIQLNNRIDAYHKIGGWLQARIIQIQKSQNQQPSQRVKVHFTNYHSKYDMWVNLKDNDQVTIIGARSKAYGIGKRKSRNNKSNLSQMILKILEKRTQNLIASLKKKQLKIKRSNGDGNCLFRSISDQLYGNQKYYAEIRKLCMDYITYQKNFFQDFVTVDIQNYIEVKRKDGQWGDDIQIQALSQIYARPIEIYVFGQQPIRTFHQENQHNVQPMRLAYIGACHYDSIKKAQKQCDGLMQQDFGNFQSIFFSTYKQQMNSIIRNRNVFSNCNRLEDTIGQQIEAQQRNQTKIQDQLSKALEISEAESLLQQIEDAQIRQIKNKQQQEKIQQQIRRIQQKQIQQAKKLSKHHVVPEKQKPYWFGDLLAQGFNQRQIWFAIQCKGYDPDAVQNFLLDNLCL